MTETLQQQADGSWKPAEPIRGTRLYRVESWLRKRGLKRLGGALAWYDELWLR